LKFWFHLVAPVKARFAEQRKSSTVLRLSGSNGTFPELSNPASPPVEPEGFLFDPLGPVFVSAFVHCPGARLCPAKRDQPQQLRKTSLLEYA